MVIRRYFISQSFIPLYLLSFFFCLISFSLVYGQLDLCQSNCVSSDRLVGSTRMPDTLTHPWAVAAFPTSNGGFCKLGCQIFYAEVPKNTTCHRLCEYFYRYNITVGYSDLIEEAKLECQNGCDIGLQVCQAGRFVSSRNFFFPLSDFVCSFNRLLLQYWYYVALWTWHLS